MILSIDRKKMDKSDAKLRNPPSGSKTSVTGMSDTTSPAVTMTRPNVSRNPEPSKFTQNTFNSRENTPNQRKVSYLYSTRSGQPSEGSNLLRVRHSALGKSAPTLSINTVNILNKRIFWDFHSQ